MIYSGFVVDFLWYTAQFQLLMISFPNLFIHGTAASFSSARRERSGGECCQVIRQFLTAARGGNQRRAKPGRRLFMQRRVLCSAAFLLQNRDVNFFSQCFGKRSAQKKQKWLLPQQKNGRSKKGRVYLDNTLSRNRWHTFAGILTLFFNQQFRPWI